LIFIQTFCFLSNFLRIGKKDDVKEKMTVFTQPGATWGDLIEFLNPYGYSPKTMQSYCSFSVGGKRYIYI
jgi:FAD/FMN-containing dehydrogenase